MANSFPEQINNITGGLSLIGTDTRTFSEIADTNYDVNITMSGGKTLIVELIVHSGSIINTKTSYPEDSAFWIF